MLKFHFKKEIHVVTLKIYFKKNKKLLSEESKALFFGHF